MDLQSFFQWLQATSFAVLVREDPLLFPVTESIHVLTIAFVVGSIAVVDLRLLGVRAFSPSIRQLMGQVLPFTWGAFAFAVVTGVTLFASNAVQYTQDGPFRLKLLLLSLAAVNMLLFHAFTYRSVSRWDEALRTPFFARLAGGVSLLLWIGITACGRWIGFTVNP